MKTLALEIAKNQAEEIIKKTIPQVDNSSLQILYPPSEIPADLSVPLFGLAKQLKLNPIKLAEDISKTDISSTIFSQITTVKGYVNFSFNYQEFNKLVFDDYNKLDDKYGSSEIGKDKTIIIDYSSPNIAKPFSVGHLRSTTLGQSLYNIFEFLGYKVVGQNHIGDWGTQFGKMLLAYKKWGNKEEIEKSPIKALLELYVKIHKEEESNPDLEKESREWFKKLEQGDSEATEIWKWIRAVSLEEFERIYKMLGVKFDQIIGESFYNDKLKNIVDEAIQKGVAEWEEITPQEQLEENFPQKDKVALIWLTKYGIKEPLLLQKSDGTSLYATRELATMKHRMEKWNPEQVIYVVGSEQQLHFQQCFKAFELLGYLTDCTKTVHVRFGLIRLPEGKMSTREGRVVFLEDVLEEAVQKAKAIIAERELSDDEKETISRMIGIGAVKYADLSQDRIKDVIFDWDKMLSLDGDSAPYIQYVHTRAVSILKKSGTDISKLNFNPEFLTQKEETDFILKIAQFTEVVLQASEHYEPHRIANYLFELAQTFNRFYKNLSVLQAETEQLKNTRLLLVDMARCVIRNGLVLLGIETPDKM